MSGEGGDLLRVDALIRVAAECVRARAAECALTPAHYYRPAQETYSFV